MLENFPGYLGYGNIIAIHADWPVYPIGIGWEIALQSIGGFPFSTEFYEIDDIDKCLLFMNAIPNSKNSKHSTRLALWHEDLIELYEQGFVEGMIPVTEYEWELNKFEKIKASFGENLELDENGNILFYNENLGQITHNRPQKNQEELEDIKTFV